MHVLLNSYGAGIRRENDVFVITTADTEQRIHPAEVRTISISKGARISSDAVLLAIEHEIDVLFLDALGMPQGRIWSVRYGSISQIRIKQVEFLYSTRALTWVKELLMEKIDHQVAVLLSCAPDDDGRMAHRIRRAGDRMEEYKRKIAAVNGASVSEVAASLRGWEGAATRRYFELVSELIPEPYRFERRSHHPPADPFNACLSYGYGMLYGRVESALIKAGIDPYMGIFHRDEYNRPALVFDVIEKYRMWVDYVVIQLFQQQAFSEECFDAQPGQVLLAGLGKRILIQSVNDYLSEIVSMNGTERSRATHIDLYAQSLAQLFLNT